MRMAMLFLCAACSSAPKQATTETTSNVGTQRAATPACPPEDELEPVVRAAGPVGAEYQLEVTSCVAGQFGAPGWHVRYVATGDDSRHGELILAADDGRVLARGEPFDSYTTFSWQHDVSAHDFDGDGVDEIMDVHTREMRAVATATDVVVQRIRGGDVLPWFETHVSWDDSLVNEADPAICDGNVSVEEVAGAKVIVVTTVSVSPAAANAEQCTLGVRRFGVVNGKFAALP